MVVLAETVFSCAEILHVPIFLIQELNNIQDVLVQEDIQRLRRFIESSFQSLTSEEVAGSKFTEYGRCRSLKPTFPSRCQFLEMGLED